MPPVRRPSTLRPPHPPMPFSYLHPRPRPCPIGSIMLSIVANLEVSCRGVRLLRAFRFRGSIGLRVIVVHHLNDCARSDRSGWLPEEICLPTRSRATSVTRPSDSRRRSPANGRRQVVFVSGEAGIGNTTLRKGLCRQMLLGGLSAAETWRATSALAFPAPSCRRTCCRCWSIAATGRDRVAARWRARRDLLRGQRSVLTRALSSASDGAAVLGGGGDCLLPSAYCCRLRRPSG